MGIFSDSTRIQWTHFGKKYRLTFTKEEMDYMDLFDVMMRKIHEERPEFDGLIAYNDQNNRQVIIHGDNDLRTAIAQMKGKLKLYTTLPERGTLAAADLAGRPHRSHSVPPAVCSLFPSPSSA
uniref:PB1 domain-containing protein n=1 Tax=Panagrolaimus sp. JU765 TaxID=591449 RepID=A0AC34Q8G0_9BILA